MATLNQEQIEQKLQQIKDWQLDGNSIKKEWQFNDFIAAVGFINKMAILAEKHEHHPELFNVYNTVTLSFSTHSAGGLTDK
ncbi:MAG: 4a-hydroxytetrahydrobiopterin dehydratase, partial [Caldithrix sp.]|nr:4a-hydroxytetrahydrobiopterin dehydratase [Caldithrix sp.]